MLALATLPAPSPADEAERVARRPMMARERAAFLAAHGHVAFELAQVQAGAPQGAVELQVADEHLHLLEEKRS